MKKKLVAIIVLSLLLSLNNGCGVLGGIKDAKLPSKPATIPSGVYWATYSNIPDAPDLPGGLSIEGPYIVRRVEIGEPSTGELLASAEFPENVDSVTDTNPNDNSKYWVERIQDAKGTTTAIKLYSTAANNFYLNLSVYSVSAKIPMFSANSLMSDDGVHSPDGAVLSDPYKDPEIPIAGYKELSFRGSFKQGTKIKEFVEQAGYQTWSVRYQNGEFIFDTMKELTGRAKIEETILKPELWKPDDAKTKGNVGVYYYSDGFTGEIMFDWNYMGVPFSVKINDAKLEMRDDGEDQTTYSLSGTAEINLKSFNLGGIVYKLKDKQQKAFMEEDCFIVRKTPKPSVHWYYMDGWEYVNDFGTGFILMVNFSIGKSPTDIDYIPVADLDEIDGSYNMNFMPGMGGKATWSFKPDNR